MTARAPETKPHLSGWCSPAIGVCRGDAYHRDCQDRLDKRLLNRCECHHGHTPPPPLNGDQ